MLNWKDDKRANVCADANWIKQNGMPVHTYKQLCTITRLDWTGLDWTGLINGFLPILEVQHYNSILVLIHSLMCDKISMLNAIICMVNLAY